MTLATTNVKGSRSWITEAAVALGVFAVPTLFMKLRCILVKTDSISLKPHLFQLQQHKLKARGVIKQRKASIYR
jgi:hypothetical protein